MALLILDRLPLISLKSYTAFSVLLLTGAIFYAYTSDTTDEDEEETVHNVRSTVELLYEDPKCYWAVANMAYCLLVLFGNYIQKLVFGELRIVEADHFRQKFWNYVFYKFIFVFGVMSNEELDTLVLWCAWFSVIGFLLLHVQLGKERFDFLQMSLTSAKQQHQRLLVLLFGILCLSSLLLGLAAFIGTQLGLGVFLLLAPECLMLILRSIHVMLRQNIRLQNGDRGSKLYNVELAFDVAVLVVDLLHHAHLMIASHLTLSMSSLVILLQIRLRFNQLRIRMKRHRLVLKVRRSLKEHCKTVNPQDEMCSICWEDMEVATQLECSHLFHDECLQAWLEQDFSCPTCRQPPWKEEAKSNVEVRPVGEVIRRTFSTFGYYFARMAAPQASRAIMAASPIDQVVSQVQEVFPDYPRHLIITELLRTQSIELTISNILDSSRHAVEASAASSVPSTNTREDLNLFEPGASSVIPEEMFANRFSMDQTVKRRRGFETSDL